LMAFRNSVKVTMLSSESETARAYPPQPAFDIEPAVSNDAAPAPVLVPPLAIRTEIRADIREASAAQMWHARADALRDMTDTLPSAITRGLMPKIIALYDGFARAEGWSDKQRDPQEQAAPETPPREAPFEDEFPDEEFPDDDAKLSLAPAAPAWLSFARRPLPSPRHAGRRRY
ncbi:MAG TPA: hypothetical protein VHY80_04170, partial [Stellaceae bacterium]|nr:hypothetical protein [Stellaceae bacterium]